MNISVPSRFACLKIEGEEEGPRKALKKPHKQKKIDKNDKNQDIKKITKQDKSEKQQIVFSKKERKAQNVPQKQWEEWKEKDDELVNGSYQKDLENAILLSKLDYEEKKDFYEAIPAEASKRTEKKKKGTKTISLDKFLENQKQNTKVENPPSTKSTTKPNAEAEANFFDKVRSEMVHELNKEKLIQNRKSRNANIETVITAAQYQEKLKLELDKNDELDKEISELKLELMDVKIKNEELSKILDESELKEKADILLELERLNTIKNDLMEEVTKLHTMLEQERSKVASLTAELQKNKDKKFKKHT